MIKKKIAIVYDWLDKWGGVERILLVFHEIFPEADFFTSYYDVDGAYWAKDINVKTSFLQHFPNFIKKNRILSFVFYPYTFESFNYSDYDLVISVTSSFAKGIVTKPGTKHICYLLTPTRYLWVQPENYFKNKFINFCLVPYINHIKKWDFVAAQRPDKIISISKTVADRCQKYYQRESEVIYPPFNIDYWSQLKFKIQNSKFETNFKFKISNFKFFLVVSRLESYKKIDLVVRSFNRSNQNLIIVGEGSQENILKAMAGKNIQFFKKLTDEELGYLYSQAQALIMPQEEDFGYVSLESLFFDCPVIAFKKGGATETIVDGKTGLFFSKQSEISLLQALERFNKISYNLKRVIQENKKRNLDRFSKKEFIRNFRQLAD